MAHTLEVQAKTLHFITNQIQRDHNNYGVLSRVQVLSNYIQLHCIKTFVHDTSLYVLKE